MNARFLIFIILSLTAGMALSDGDFDAEQYHEGNCMACHDSQVYTREDHRVNSLPGLESQVRMCDANLGKKLFDDDLLSLTNYLNSHYYHFSK